MADLFAAAAGLTRREVEVYRLERAGYGAEGISARLMIQPGTVRTHLKRLHAKLVAAELRVPNARYQKGQRDERDTPNGPLVSQ
jgi:DNA-binding NarL/FixJ family response regulator